MKTSVPDVFRAADFPAAMSAYFGAWGLPLNCQKFGEACVVTVPNARLRRGHLAFKFERKAGPQINRRRWETFWRKMDNAVYDGNDPRKPSIQISTFLSPTATIESLKALKGRELSLCSQSWRGRSKQTSQCEVQTLESLDGRLGRIAIDFKLQQHMQSARNALPMMILNFIGRTLISRTIRARMAIDAQV